MNREKSSSLDSGLARDSMKSLKRSNTISASRGISKYTQKLNMGEARDDVHVCIMCLRAIMNHQVRNTGNCVVLCCMFMLLYIFCSLVKAIVLGLSFPGRL